MDLGLKARDAIIGGSSRGLGRAIALAFARKARTLRSVRVRKRISAARRSSWPALGLNNTSSPSPLTYLSPETSAVSYGTRSIGSARSAS